MKISDILDSLNREKIPFLFDGSPDAEVNGFSSLTKYKDGTFTWVKAQGNIPRGFDTSKIRLAFVSEGVTGDFQNTIRASESKRAFFSSVEYFVGQDEELPAIGHGTYISPRVELGKNVRIGHNCTLDGEITIGDGTVIRNNVVVVNRVQIGKRCEIHSGAVIGHDGFAYTEDEKHVKTMIKHYGGVAIGEDVTIFDNVCITRGTIDDTVIEDGVKIDSLSHIAHNVHIKRNSALAAPCRLNGSVTVGENAYIAGAVVRNQCTVGDSAFVGLGAVVVKDVPAGITVAGVPAKPIEKKE